jgi:hypothetical protein
MIFRRVVSVKMRNCAEKVLRVGLEDLAELCERIELDQVPAGNRV